MGRLTRTAVGAGGPGNRAGVRRRRLVDASGGAAAAAGAAASFAVTAERGNLIAHAHLKQISLGSTAGSPRREKTVSLSLPLCLASSQPYLLRGIDT